MNRPFPPLPALRALLLLLSFALAATPAARASQPWRPTPVVELEIVDRETGQVLPHHRYRGQHWVAGEPGHRYAVRLRNRGGTRVLAVLSVDGVNAIDGRTADPRQAGYVLGPWQTLEVAGWRKSLDAVAQFVFVDPAASYAARTGRPANLGVIGVAVFREKAAYPYPAPGIAQPRQAARSEASTAEAAEAPAADAAHGERRIADRYGEPYPQASLGTGHGALEGSHAYHTSFEREAAPAQVSELRYDTRAALLARGIRIEPPYRPYYPYPTDRPRAFPGGFVPDPR